MESNKPASVFAIAVMVGIFAYAVTDNPWMFAVGFFGCFITVLIHLAFVISATRSRNNPKPAPKTYADIASSISYASNRPILEPVAHEDR